MRIRLHSTINPQSPATTMSKPAGVNPQQILHAKLKHEINGLCLYWEIYEM